MKNIRISRGKDAITNEWVYGIPLFKNNDIYIVEDFELNNDYGEGTDLYATEWCLIDSKTVGQHTGLEDMNGKGIFFGDMVKVFDLYDKISFVGEVMYGNASFYIFDECVSHYRWMDYEVEVIGSIHDIV